MTAGRVILWRHGQTDYNVELRIQGALDMELNETGLAQARNVAPYIASMHPNRILSSPLKRAYATAQVVAELCGLDIEIDARMVERRFGKFEGLSRRELEARYPDPYRRWKAGDDMSDMGIEKRLDVGQRVSAAIIEAAETMGEDEVLLAVAHGAALSCATAVMLGMDPDVWGGIAGLDNCHWTLLRPFSGEPGWRMLAHDRIVSTELEGELGVQGIGSIES